MIDKLELIRDWTPSRYPHPSPDIRMRMSPPRVPEGDNSAMFCFTGKSISVTKESLRHEVKSTKQNEVGSNGDLLILGEGYSLN